MSLKGFGALVACALSITVACTSTPDDPTEPPAPYGTPARIVARIAVPDSGGVGVGAGAVWVLDRRAGGIDHPNQEPFGLLYRIDPRTNEVTARIRGVMGAGVTIGEGAAWVGSPIFNRLLRVDLDTHAIESIATGPTDDESPFQVVITPGAVWAPNHHAGTVARIDPPTRSIISTVRWGAAGAGGPRHLATDGSDIWLAATRNSKVVRIDARTAAVTEEIDLAPSGTCGGIALDPSSLWVASGYDSTLPCGEGAPTLSRIDIDSGRVVSIELEDRALDVAPAFGSVWVLTGRGTGFPAVSALVRIDPRTDQVLGELPLTGTPDPEDPLNVGFGAIWVRLDDQVLRLEPTER
jgi:hypothetical protein